MADLDQAYADRLQRETEDRLLRLVKRTMIERGKDISECALRQQGIPENLLPRFLAMEVGRSQHAVGGSKVTPTTNVALEL